MNPNTPHVLGTSSQRGSAPVPLTEMVHMDMSPFSSPCRLLIVDDIPDIRLFLREGLKDYGYHCDEAQHGLEALQKLQACHYDIVLTDLQMPFLDGFELARSIHQDRALGNPLVIMMTASDTALLAPLALALGIKKVFSKPCLPCEIHQEILNELSRFPHAA